jgi:L-lactate dehydrogenase complex protein LldG
LFTRVELFCQKFDAVGGKLINEMASLPDVLKDAASKKGYVDPYLLPLLRDALAGFEIDTVFHRAKVDEYAFGITRATAGIAESGSLLLTGVDTSSRLGALAPWIHIAVLERAKIVPTIPDAIALFGSETNALFVTGPSKTADVEGILIKGVHGPGVQVCCLV